MSKDGVKVAIECTTANPTGRDKSGPYVYEPTNEKDVDLEALRARQENEVPIRIAGALRNKMLHRLNKKRSPAAYWELPHVADNPFVLAIQTFHEHGSLAFSNAAVVRYLYGIAHRPSWDESGNLVINVEQVREHSHGEKIIPSGFFDLPELGKRVGRPMDECRHRAEVYQDVTRRALSGRRRHDGPLWVHDRSRSQRSRAVAVRLHRG